MPDAITNFGGNVQFRPRHVYVPTNEEEVLAILDRHADGKIRVMGSKHAWSPAIVSDDVLLDMSKFDGVSVQRDETGVVWATVGGGCRIKAILRRLHELADVTMPSIGLITEQTIAGAISTATHGSGRHSLSHYMDEIRVAAYDPVTGKARVYELRDGPELRAARCSLGCMGVILSVRFRCVPRYDVEETIVPCAAMADALAGEEQYPLQQFYLVPHLWSYFAQRRRVTREPRKRRSVGAWLYRVWWFWFIDIGLHLVIKALTSILKSPALVRFFYKHLLAKLILKNTTVIDASERMLVMEHELFKHLEIEIFVPAQHVERAAAFVQAVLQVFDGASDAPPADVAQSLQSIGMLDELTHRRGTFTHHYAVTFRRVLPDDALIATSSGTEVYYAISFITYVEPREPFYALASFLARSMTKLLAARLHWGKYFPLTRAEIDSTYPHLDEFCALCKQVDPRGVFRNEFVDRVLFKSES